MGPFGKKQRAAPQPQRPVKRKRATKAELAARLKDELAVEQARLALQRQREEREYLTWLQTNDPLRYRAMIERRLGLGDGAGKGAGSHRAGPTTIMDVLASAAENIDVGQLLTVFRGAGAPALPPSPMPYQPPAAPAVQPPTTPPVDAAGTAPPEQTPNPVPPSPIPGGPLSMESRWLIGQMEGKAPAERAAWLIGLDFPLAREMVAHLLTCSEAQLPQLWGALTGANPATAGFIAWLTAQPDYLATIAEVRRQGIAAAQGNGQAEPAPAATS